MDLSRRIENNMLFSTLTLTLTLTNNRTPKLNAGRFLLEHSSF